MSTPNQALSENWLSLKTSEKYHPAKRNIYVLATIIVFLISCSSFLNVWVYTQWLFSYEFGIVKRGLLGEILRIAGIVPTYELIKTSSLFISVVMVALFSAFYYKAILIHRYHTGAFFIALFLLLHPATTQHFVYEIARFDNFIYILILTCIGLIFRTSPNFGLLCILFFFTFMNLLHEASFFIALPLLLGIWCLLHKQKLNPVRTLIVAAILIAAIFEMLYISTKGLDGIINSSVYYAKLLAIDAHAHFDAILVLYRTLGDNLFLTFSKTIEPYNIQRHLIMAIGLTPTFIIFRRIFLITLHSVGFRSFEFALLITSLSPLVLYPLGYDQLRWWAMAIANLSIATIVIVVHNHNIGIKLMDYFFEAKWFIAFSMLLGVAFGPLTVLHSFIRVRVFIDEVYRLLGS